MITIKEKEKCCGCTACVNICPKHCIIMERDTEGFSYPVVQKQECIQCGLCEKVCPVLNKNKEEQGQTSAYAVYTKAESVREMSSSGGVFPLVADKILQKGGYVFGCAFDSEFVAEHILVQDMSELERLQGSKYVQSDLKDSFVRIRELLEAGKDVLFSGTPCQIEGLKKYLNKTYKTLFLIDIVCHGVPSPMVWESYKSFQEKAYGSPIKSFSFRNKDYGWKNYRVKICFENGEIYSSRNWDDIYMKSYLKGLVSRPSCYECRFRQWHREADLTLGDFWGVEQVLPQWNDDRGISLVMVHTDKGRQMLEAISNQIECEEVSQEAAIGSNPSIVMSNEIPDEREKFWSVLMRKGYAGAVQQYVQDGLIGKVKNVLRRLKM